MHCVIGKLHRLHHVLLRHPSMCLKMPKIASTVFLLAKRTVIHGIQFTSPNLKHSTTNHWIIRDRSLSWYFVLWLRATSATIPPQDCFALPLCTFKVGPAPAWQIFSHQKDGIIQFPALCYMNLEMVSCLLCSCIYSLNCAIEPSWSSVCCWSYILLFNVCV